MVFIKSNPFLVLVSLESSTMAVLRFLFIKRKGEYAIFEAVIVTHLVDLCDYESFSFFPYVSLLC